MDAVDRINDLFGHLLSLGHDRLLTWPFAEQVVFVVVCTRCEKDMEGFESVFEQLFGPQELTILIDGLRKMGEAQLADEFSMAFDLLDRDGFYRHRNWNLVSPFVVSRIGEIGDRVGEQLWCLDEKLVALVEGS